MILLLPIDFRAILYAALRVAREEGVPDFVMGEVGYKGEENMECVTFDLYELLDLDTESESCQ